MANAEHPLVAPHRTHTAPDLIGQGLEAQTMISPRQRAGNWIARPLLRLDGKKDIDRLAKAAP